MENEEKPAITSTTDCSFNMETNIGDAAGVLASAMEEQAVANAENGRALKALALALKPIEICAVKITNDGINSGNFTDPTEVEA